MKKIFSLLLIAAIAFYFYSCEKESPTQEQIAEVETNQPLYLEDNPVNPNVPEATVAIKPVPLRKNATTVTEDPPAATLLPASLAATLAAGESVAEHKVLSLPADAIHSQADVLFALDLTGSMDGELANAKNHSINIMNAIVDSIGDVQFGVVSHMDYPETYSSCGYSNTYGAAWAGDYPYRLDQVITDNNADVATAINSLRIGNGYDAPESYTRVLYETYSDPLIIWRDDSKKIVVFWMDNIPHDCDLDINNCQDIVSTGADPGRDNTANTTDDLDFQDVLSEMANSNITLLALASKFSGSWNCWAQKTGAGGQAFKINTDGTVPGDTDIATVIADLVNNAVNTIGNIKLQVCTPGYEGWLVHPGVTYSNIILDSDQDFEFDIEIQVPEGTPDGDYCFEVCAVGDGVEYASQEVCITVASSMDVSLDVKPTSCPNPFNMRAKGTLPAAILGTADFDVTRIDPATVTLMGVPATRSNLEDVAAPYTGDELFDRNDCTTDGPDGFMDMTFKFDRQAIAAALGSVADGDEVVVEINGQLLDGTPLVGYDIIWIKKKGN